MHLIFPFFFFREKRGILLKRTNYRKWIGNPQTNRKTIQNLRDTANKPHLAPCFSLWLVITSSSLCLCWQHAIWQYMNEEIINMWKMGGFLVLRGVNSRNMDLEFLVNHPCQWVVVAESNNWLSRALWKMQTLYSVLQLAFHCSDSLESGLKCCLTSWN